MQAFHQLSSRERVIAKCREEAIDRSIILVDILIAVLVGTVPTSNIYFTQGIPYNFQYQFDKTCTVCLCVRCTERIVVLLLPRLDQFLHR